jgi:putative FmdB family regulatory protein
MERIQKFSDPPLDTCPTCGGRLKKLLSSPAIQFKGSGWYITDYARKSSNGGKKAESAEKAEKSEPAGTEKAEKTEKAPKTDKPSSATKSDG